MVSKYFILRDNQYEVNLLLREGIRFEYHNLNDPVYPNNFDIIFAEMYSSTSMSKHVCV